MRDSADRAAFAMMGQLDATLGDYLAILQYLAKDQEVETSS